MAWAGLCVLFALGAALAWFVPAQALDWQPDKPWRAFSAPFVHLSPFHLTANLAGCAVLAWLGFASRLPRRCAEAWLLAWPLGTLALLVRPEITHFGGLSGVLHAGVAIVVVELLSRTGRERKIGAAIAIGLVLKLVLEQPLGDSPLRTVDGWDIAVVPLSHLCGAIAGLACALALRSSARHER